MDGKICQNMKFNPLPRTFPSSVQLSTWERLGYIWFLHFFNSLKKFFEQTKIELFQKNLQSFHTHCFQKY